MKQINTSMIFRRSFGDNVVKGKIKMSKGDQKNHSIKI